MTAPAKRIEIRLRRKLGGGYLYPPLNLEIDKVTLGRSMPGGAYDIWEVGAVGGRVALEARSLNDVREFLSDIEDAVEARQCAS